MFETYTDATRKAIFIGLYEASQFGSESVEVEHLLLGLLRADPSLVFRLFQSHEKVEKVRERIEQETPRRKSTISPSVDLPLSSGSERALNHAAAEASRFQQSHVAPVHLLLGIVQDQTSLAAQVLLESGISFSQIEEEARQPQSAGSAPARPVVHGSPGKDFHDLVAEARSNSVRPLFGRQRELEQILQILSRRTKNNPVLVGEPGVGKEAIVYGLAQQAADGDAPADLLDRPILLVDRGEILRTFDLSRPAGPTRTALQRKLSEVASENTPIVYVRGLFDGREDIPALAADLARGRLQLIATGTPLSLRLALAREDELARHFEIVTVLPPTEAEAVDMVTAMKREFEKFHQVVVSPEAIQTAVSASGHFLRYRPLPDRALDLIDEAGVRVKLRRDRQPPEITGLQRRLRTLVRQLEQAIVNHEFEQARNLSEEERSARQTMTRLREELEVNPPSNVVSPDDIVEVIAARTSLTAMAVRAALERTPESDPQEEARKEWAARIPVGRRDWVDGFLAYLADCSREDMNRLSQMIQTAQTKFEQNT